MFYTDYQRFLTPVFSIVHLFMTLCCLILYIIFMFINYKLKYTVSTKSKLKVFAITLKIVHKIPLTLACS